MATTADATLPMDAEELRQAREASLEAITPPLRLPGYEDEQFLGRGAFGEVWRAVDVNSGRKVVVKFFNRRGGLDWSLLAREVEKLRYLFSDRHVIQLLSVGWEASPPYYVMEYMENGSLEQLLRAGPLPVERALEVFREVAAGLAHAHGKGIIHCDLKPANILLDREGNPRIADFGQSRLSHEQAAALGTLFYMAPEQADLHAAPDARWDVYALGAIFYHMLVGAPPYRDAEGAAAVLGPGRLEERLARYRRLLAESPEPTAHRAAPGVDAALADVIDRCLAVDPRKRFRDVASVLHALEARATRRAQRPLLFLGILGPLLVLLVVAGLGWNVLGRVIKEKRGELLEGSTTSNRLAAQALAERFANEVEARWRILEAEAADPTLIRLLATDPGSPAAGRDADEVRRWIADRRAHWNARFSEKTRASFWFAVDRRGRVRALSPHEDSLVNAYFGYRDYFHGGGAELSPDAPCPPPIRLPHRSNVYPSKGNHGALSVTFSVPVLGPDRREPLGVLAMETVVGHFTEFQGENGQHSALFDVRKDAGGDERGRIVAHSKLDEFEDPSKQPALRVKPEVIRKAEEVLADRLNRRPAGRRPDLDPYLDPFGPPSVGGQWLAVVEPVIIRRNDVKLPDSDWFVIVEEPEQRILKPLNELRDQIWRNAGVALALVLAVVSALWAFVVLVLQQGRHSRVLSYWRRSMGMPSLSSVPTGSLSGSLRSPASERVGPAPVARQAANGPPAAAPAPAVAQKP